MKQPDPQTVEALTRLEHDTSFKKILEWVRTSREDITLELIGSEAEPYMRQCQGALRELNEIIEVAENARDTLNRMR